MACITYLNRQTVIIVNEQCPDPVLVILEIQNRIEPDKIKMIQFIKIND